jgi:beta-lactamase regulating signal transducer with metallopeptidase domain
MKTSSQLLLTFLLNAVWQIALIAALASFGAWLLRKSTMRYQHWLWVGALCLSVVIPAVTAFRALPAGPSAVAETSFNRDLTNPVLTGPIDATFERTSADASSSTFQLNRTLALFLLVAYGAFLIYRGFKLAQAWYTTRKIRNSATELEPDEDLAAIICQCETSLKLKPGRVRISHSESLPVPVTAGLFRPVIILPETLLREGDTDLLTSAIGHEFIHVARHDYVLNFIYELLYLPVSFHPAAALLRSRIKQTRELCCDELVTERILNAETYARSLVALASSAPPLRRLSVTTTVGIADADILEARIMSLLSKPKMNRRWKKSLLVAVSLLLLIPSFAAAALAMRFELADPQDPVQQEKELEEKKKATAREGSTADAFKERMARDPNFRAEMQRKQELEMEMRTLKQAALVRLSRVTMDQAIQIATSHAPGKVLSSVLDADRWEEPGKLAKDGTVFYHVIVADEANAEVTTHVVINAIDGTIITIDKSGKELPRKMRSPGQ